MKRNARLARLGLVAGLWLALPTTRGAVFADTAAPQVSVARPWTRAVVVPVTVNGHGPYSFLIDTGSSHTAISAGLAARLDAPRVARAMVSTAAGNAWAAVVRLDRLTAGPLEQTGVLATELALDGFDGPAFDGVLGLDVLGQVSFVLDYRQGTVTWAVPRSEPEGVRLPLDMTGPVWLVRLSEGTRTRTLVPDSGATSLVVFDRGQWPELRQRPGTIDVGTVTGGATGRAGVLSRLNLGALQFVDQGVTIVDGSRVSAAHGDGLLPLHWFDRVVFDCAGGHIVLVHLPASNLQASGLRIPGALRE